MKQNDNLKAKLESKKMLFVLALIVIPTFFFFVFLQMKQIEPQETPPADLTAKVTTAPSPTVTPSIQKWFTYQTNEFSMQYPPGWVSQNHTTEDGGLLVKFMPTELPEGVYYPQFLLQRQKASDDALAMKKEILKGLGLKESKTAVAKIDAIKFSGTIPFKTVGSQNVKEPIQDGTILFVANDSLYTLKYEYEGDALNKDLEQYFDDFIASFKLAYPY